jgi:hypothetical protein
METIECEDGFTVTIEQDEDPQSPDEWGDEEVFLGEVHHRNYRKFGRKDHHTAPIDEDGSCPFEVYPVRLVDYGGANGCKLQFLDKDEDDNASGRIFVKRLTPLEMLGRVITMDELAENLLQTWNTYLQGEVYAFSIRDADGEYVDSCGGYYGYDECHQEALSAVDSHRAHLAEETRQAYELTVARWSACYPEVASELA